MTKAELVSKIAVAADITKAAAEKALGSFVDAVTEAVKAGDKVTLVGFGTFSSVTRAARTGRNPQTGKSIKIAERTNGKFSPGKNLKDIKAVKAKPKAKAPAKKK
ncbi:MAG: DNA-binding protein HU [Geobacteraceae bacterium GWC2_48_7]|jgi:DNA-binding protein HU-beta|nr:MAG: DNA-binding protein HU [Geobacteraceae bacterium GWC2_48_7]